MKIAALTIALGLFTFLFAKNETVCHPPQNVQAQIVYNGAQISWDYTLPDTAVSYNNSNPSAFWTPVEHQALGVVFDLSAFSGATLEQIDFAHFSHGKLAGPYLYNIWIFDMDSMTTIVKIDSLAAGDANDYPRFETAVELGSIPARAHVGIFVEGLSMISYDGKTHNLPALMTDDGAYVPNVNFYLGDVNDPWLESDPDYTNFYEANVVASGATNYVLDLWLNLGNGKQLVNAVAEPDTFRIFRGASEEDLLKIGEVVNGEHSFVDTEAPGDSTYVYAVSASCVEGTSGRVPVTYTHPMIYSVGGAQIDADQNYIPDLLNEKIYVKGIVNSPNFDVRSDYFIQSGNGGMRLSNSNFNLDLNIGDSVFVQGIVQQVNGVTGIVPETADQVLVFSEGNSVDTLALTLADVSEEYEGMLVSIEGTSVLNPDLWPAEGFYSTQVRVSDALDTLNLILDQDTDLDGITPPEGSFRLVGIVDQIAYGAPADWGYYIRPRFMKDLGGLTSIGDRPEITPGDFILNQNYPNPFNPTTAINYQLSAISEVELAVFNTLGQKVQTLVNGLQTAGKHTIRFDASGLASGIYYYTLRAGNNTVTRKMVLMR